MQEKHGVILFSSGGLHLHTPATNANQAWWDCFSFLMLDTAKWLVLPRHHHHHHHQQQQQQQTQTGCGFNHHLQDVWIYRSSIRCTSLAPRRPCCARRRPGLWSNSWASKNDHLQMRGTLPICVQTYISYTHVYDYQRKFGWETSELRTFKNAQNSVK